MYNKYTAETSERLAYDPAEISEIRRFWIDFNRKINSDWMKGIALGTLLVGFVLAMVCPSFAPVYLITLAGVGLSLVIGGIVAGSRSSEAGGEFQRGFVEYINETWAPTLTVEMLTAIVTFGITKAVGAIKSAGAKKLADVVDDTVVDGITIRKVRQDELTPEAFREMQSLTHTIDGQTKSSIASGKKIHKGFRNTADGRLTTDRIFGAGRTTGKYGYVDSIDTINKVIYELKPNNAKSIAAGIKQLKRYGASRPGYTLVLVLY